MLRNILKITNLNCHTETFVKPLFVILNHQFQAVWQVRSEIAFSKSIWQVLVLLSGFAGACWKQAKDLGNLIQRWLLDCKDTSLRSVWQWLAKWTNDMDSQNVATKWNYYMYLQNGFVVYTCIPIALTKISKVINTTKILIPFL